MLIFRLPYFHRPSILVQLDISIKKLYFMRSFHKYSTSSYNSITYTKKF